MKIVKQKSQLLILSCLVSACAVKLAYGDDYTKTSTSTAADPTNTGRNKDHNGAPVADDQAKGSESDVDITRQIRRELTKNDSLSVNAKNVKIVTLNGAVTLRGPVNSDDEVKTITEAAKRHAVNNQVTCELEVKNKK